MKNLIRNRVEADLLGLIENQPVKPGERLPSERALAGQYPIEYDPAFHETLVRATGNSALSSVYVARQHILAETRSSDIQFLTRSKRSVHGHGKMLRALKNRDSAAANKAMTRHMDEIEQSLKYFDFNDNRKE